MCASLAYPHETKSPEHAEDDRAASCECDRPCLAYLTIRSGCGSNILQMLASHFQAFFFVLLPVWGDWTQEYGDPGSTNYVSFKPGTHSVKTGWSYTGPGDYSLFYYADPAVSEDGVLYIPYLYLPSYKLQVRAVAPNGTLLWAIEDLASDESCDSIRLTNALYSQEHDLVVVGWYCIAVSTYSRNAQLLAFHASRTTKVWQTDILRINDASKIAMSLKSDAVFIAGGFDCGRDLDQVTKTVPSNSRSKYVDKIYSVSLRNGSVLWELDANRTGCETQMKIGTVCERAGFELLIIPTHLSYGYYAEGGLMATRSASNNTQWITPLRITWDAKFAFSQAKNLIFGAYGFAGNPDLIFAVNSSSGNVTFSNHGFCSDGAFPSGPAVDRYGDAYFR